MKESQNWRELLKEIISVAQERHRIAHELKVNAVTLQRWAQDETRPRRQYILPFLDALPLSYKEQMSRLLAKEFPNLIPTVEAPPIEETNIPSEVYNKILHARAHAPLLSARSAICEQILEHGLKQLDPQGLGMSMVVALCLPPVDRKRVRSLLFITGRGTPPWENNLERYAVLLGAESLSGSAALSGHRQINQLYSDHPQLSPGYLTEKEGCAVAVPLMRNGRIAGSLRISSTCPDYFYTARFDLIDQYAQLLTTALNKEDFYAPEQIQLGFFPLAPEQRKHFGDFRQRVSQVMKQSTKEEQPLSVIQAELKVWQLLEEELLQLMAVKP